MISKIDEDLGGETTDFDSISPAKEYIDQDSSETGGTTDEPTLSAMRSIPGIADISGDPKSYLCDQMNSNLIKITGGFPRHING